MRLKPRFSLLLTGPKAGLVGEPDHDWSVHPLHYDRVLAYTAEDIAAARRDALEEAIGALHGLYAALPEDRPTIRQEIAAIRALIEKEE